MQWWHNSPFNHVSLVAFLYFGSWKGIDFLWHFSFLRKEKKEQSIILSIYLIFNMVCPSSIHGAWLVHFYCALQATVIIITEFYLPEYTFLDWKRSSGWLESWEGLLLTTVLLRTPTTQMIFFNQGMLLLGSNHFLMEYTLCIINP